MTDIVVEAGRDLVMDFGPVTRTGSDYTRQPVDLALTGTKLWFTVKRTLLDAYADAVVAETFPDPGDAFAITSYSSLTIPNGTITLPDTAIDLDAGEVVAYWYWDLTLEEPDGRRETVDGGTFKVIRPVSDP